MTGTLTQGPLPRVILRLALPAVGMMGVHFTFNLIDMLWVGRLLGPAALAAVSTGGFFVWIVLSLAEMMDVGLVAVAARRHGQGLPEQAARAAAGAIAAGIAAGAVTAGLGLILTNALFHVMLVPAEVAALGRDYLHVWLLGAPLVFGFFALEAAFRASGDTRTPFMVLAASVTLNVVLDPLLITGVGPFPKMGVGGAAVASVLVRGGAFVLGMIVALRRGLIAWRMPDWRVVPTVLRIGAPLSLAGVLLSLIYVWLTRYTSRFGTAALAALGIGHKMEGLGFIAITGFALAAGALVGQNLGAGHEDRARRAVWLTVGYCLTVTLSTAALFLAIPRTLVGLFTTDPAVIDAGALYLRIISIAQVGQTFELIFEGALAGAGYTLWPMVVSTSLTALRLPLSAWWSGVFGLVGIWWALSLTAASRGVAMMLFWRGGAWKRSVV